MPTESGVHNCILYVPNSVDNLKYDIHATGYSIYKMGSNMNYQNSIRNKYFICYGCTNCIVDNNDKRIFIQPTMDVIGTNGLSVISGSRNIYVSEDRHEIKKYYLMLGDILHINGHRYVVVDFNGLHNEIYKRESDGGRYLVESSITLMTLNDTSTSDVTTTSEKKYAINSTGALSTNDITTSTFYRNELPKMIEIIENDFSPKEVLKIEIPTLVNSTSFKITTLKADLPTPEQLGFTSFRNSISNELKSNLHSFYNQFALFQVGINPFSSDILGGKRDIWLKDCNTTSCTMLHGFRKYGLGQSKVNYRPLEELNYVSLVFYVNA